VSGSYRLSTAKVLAPNDNSKNQVYFGPGFGALNVIPSGAIAPDPKGRPTFRAALDFAWLDSQGGLEPAPGAQLILYPEYPEVRFSGFLRRTVSAPSTLMTSRTPGRVLFLGITGERRVIGVAVSADTRIAREFRNLPSPASVGVFVEIPISQRRIERNPREVLLRQLTRINAKGWIDSKRLRSDGTVTNCTAPQCGGYTLEAELGIRPNSLSEPDFMGWEIKQHGVPALDRLTVGVITLMTPEPTGGYYKASGPEAFVRRFGYADVSGRPDRFNFGGIHVADRRHPRTGLILRLRGVDAKSLKILDVTGGLSLESDRGVVAAHWRYSALMEHWNRKHALAAYVPSICRQEPTRQYQYGNGVRLGEGVIFQNHSASRSGVFQKLSPT